MKKYDIKALTREELNGLLLEKGFKECHSREIFKAIYKKGCNDFFSIPGIPKTVQRFMTEQFYVSNLTAKKREISQDGTQKFAISLVAGKEEENIECVYIPEDQRGTVCVSSQVGCKFGCLFCVSGRGGFVRNLTVGEMVNQVTMVDDLMGTGKVSNVVFMGTGEPLDNYDNLKGAVTILRDAQGLAIAKRKISLSTCGVVPGIERLIEDKQGLRLSVSLHSGDNKKRSALMPINKIYPLEMLKKSVQTFSEREGLPIFFEYIMIRGVNVSREDAHSLVGFVKDLHCKINLIPYNPSPYYTWLPPEQEEIDVFRTILEEARVFYWIRKARGQDIAAACGLLKESKKLEKNQ